MDPTTQPPGLIWTDWQLDVEGLERCAPAPDAAALADARRYLVLAERCLDLGRCSSNGLLWLHQQRVRHDLSIVQQAVAELEVLLAEDLAAAGTDPAPATTSLRAT